MSGSDFLGVVPLDVDFLESECTNHVARSTYTSDLLLEVQAEEPFSSPTLIWRSVIGVVHRTSWLTT